MYEAFRKIIDYFYLDDLSVLEGIQDSTEMTEIIKLSKLFKLDDLFRAAEIHFQETMVSWFENSSVFSLNIENLQKRRAIQQAEETEVKIGSNQLQKESLRARVTQ